MFCPGCGKECLDDKNFCNSCGTNLLAVKQALTGQTPHPQPHQIALNPAKRKFIAASFFTIGGGIVFAITISIVSDMLRHINPDASRIVESLIPFCSIFFIVGTMLMVYAKMMFKSSEQVTVAQAPQLPPLQQSLPHPQRSFTGYTPPSVTERTTAELKPPPSFKVKE